MTGFRRFRHAEVWISDAVSEWDLPGTSKRTATRTARETQNGLPRRNAILSKTVAFYGAPRGELEPHAAFAACGFSDYGMLGLSEPDEFLTPPLRRWPGNTPFGQLLLRPTGWAYPPRHDLICGYRFEVRERAVFVRLRVCACMASFGFDRQRYAITEELVFPLMRGRPRYSPLRKLFLRPAAVRSRFRQDLGLSDRSRVHIPTLLRNPDIPKRSRIRLPESLAAIRLIIVVMDARFYPRRLHLSGTASPGCLPHPDSLPGPMACRALCRNTPRSEQYTGPGWSR